MKLVDLRRVAVKKHLRIRFDLSNGMECVVNERGVAQVPALHAAPSFNLEEELSRASRFLVEPAGEAANAKMKPRSYTTAELAALAATGSAEAHPEAHDE